MKPSVTVIDFGIGNLKSVARACEEAGGNVELSADPARIAGADRLVLPGVGAFPKCVAELRRLGLDEAIRTFMESQRPFLGICVGAQMMLDGSDEFGRHDGFGFIPGRVEAMPPRGADKAYKIPHVGWNTLQKPAGIDWNDTPLDDAREGEAFYFTHSFAMQPRDAAATLASCTYFHHRFAAVIREDHQYGCQFHPEKSGSAGLMFLENFISF
jgi:imidazole glycerol-phosphate synthase subunit HisH